MSKRASKICLAVYGLLLLFSLSVLSVPGGSYWQCFAVMLPFAIVPLFSNDGRYRIAGLLALLLACFLIAEDVAAGKRYHERRHAMRRAAELKAAANSEYAVAANGSQPLGPNTNTPSAVAGPSSGR